MLDAIAKEVLPAYMRFARFLEVSYIPAGREPARHLRLPDGRKYYQFLLRRTTTTGLTADQIHQIGVDEVKKDEAEMLAIARSSAFRTSRPSAPALSPTPKIIRPMAMRCSLFIVAT